MTTLFVAFKKIIHEKKNSEKFGLKKGGGIPGFASILQGIRAKPGTPPLMIFSNVEVVNL